MKSNLKRDQIPQNQATNWRANFEDEKRLTFDLIVPEIILQKETYKKLAGENENRVRIYLGLESQKNDNKYEIAAFAVSAFLLGSGDVYVDYEIPVFKLGKINEDYSSKTEEVINSLKRFRDWRIGELDNEKEHASIRQFIYPKAFLLTKYELHEIFNAQKREEAIIELGIAKNLTAMILPKSGEDNVDKDIEIFSYSQSCPPNCDERSIYNS